MIKNTVVAGSFYPNHKDELRKLFNEYFLQAEKEISISKPNIDKLIGVIVPHAGYVYSGKTAAYAYSLLAKKQFTNAVIIAPSHYSGYFDFSVGKYEKYRTPLGDLEVNQTIVNKLLTYDKFCFSEIAEIKEHSLEVQLPFIKYIKPDTKIIPIIIGNQNHQNALYLAQVLTQILDEETVIVASSDLSHFHKAAIAEKLDSVFIQNVLENKPQKLWNDLISHKTEACGYGGVLALLEYANNRFKEIEITALNYTHSGYISNDFYQVVGYFSSAVYKKMEV